MKAPASSTNNHAFEALVSVGSPPVFGRAAGTAVAASAVGDGDGVGGSVGEGVCVAARAVGDGVGLGVAVGVGGGVGKLPPVTQSNGLALPPFPIDGYEQTSRSVAPGATLCSQELRMLHCNVESFGKLSPSGNGSVAVIRFAGGSWPANP